MFVGNHPRFQPPNLDTSEHTVAQDLISRILDWLASRLPTAKPEPVPVRVRTRR